MIRELTEAIEDKSAGRLVVFSLQQHRNSIANAPIGMSGQVDKKF